MTREELAARLYTEAADLLVQEGKTAEVASTLGGAIAGNQLARSINEKLYRKRGAKFNKKYEDLERKNLDDEEYDKAREKLDKEFNDSARKYSRATSAISAASTLGGGVLGNKLNKIIENYIAAKKATSGKTANQLDALIDKLEAFIKKYEDSSADPAWKKANKSRYTSSKAILKKAKAQRARLVKESIDEFGDDGNYLEESYTGLGSIFDQLNDSYFD